MDFDLEPPVRRIVALANRLDRDERDIPWTRRRAEGAAMARRFRRVAMPDGPEMASEVNHLVPVAGGRIYVREYRPGPGRLPVHVFLHGGGWCVGSLDERDPRCREIAAGANCVVFSVDYRMAPENTFPTAPEDCFAAMGWIVDEADRLGVDASQMGVSGESAGANLAAVMALMSRDRGGPAIAHQWLDVPAVDLTMTQPSVTSTPPGYLLDHQAMVDFREAYLRTEADQVDAYASPLHADDLSGLAPAWILTCGADPLRDDGTAYAAALRAAGVEVVERHLSGHVHPSFAFTRIASAAAYQRDAIAALRAALHPSASR